MARYSLSELLGLWYRKELTVEQVIGQMIQHLLALQKQLADLKRQLPKPPPKKEG